MPGMFAMLHEWFIDQLRSKVNRGTGNAFERGSNIHGAAALRKSPLLPEDTNVLHEERAPRGTGGGSPPAAP